MELPLLAMASAMREEGESSCVLSKVQISLQRVDEIMSVGK